MLEPALKCENNAIFKQIYNIEQLIAFDMAYSCCFSLGGNLDFLEFLQKKFGAPQLSLTKYSCDRFLQVSVTNFQNFLQVSLTIFLQWLHNLSQIYSTRWHVSFAFFAMAF